LRQSNPDQVYLAAAKVGGIHANAKIDGIKLCESCNRQLGASHGLDYRSVLPTNLYGPGDNHHPENSHVIPALIRRFHEAKVQPAPSVALWGTGLRRPSRACTSSCVACPA